MELQNIENLPCKVEYINNGFCSVTFNIEESELNGFVLMLNGLSGLFRSLKWKSKINIDVIHANNEKKKEKQNEDMKHFENDVCKMYSELFIREQNSRVAFSLTVSKIKNQYAFSSYDIVKNCLTKNKYLKKTGFYSNRHKIE